MKLLMRLFRFSRAPFGTSKFGVQMKDAKQSLLEAWKQNDSSSQLLEMLLPSIASDLGVDVSSLQLRELYKIAGASLRIFILSFHLHRHEGICPCFGFTWTRFFEQVIFWYCLRGNLYHVKPLARRLLHIEEQPNYLFFRI